MCALVVTFADAVKVIVDDVTISLPKRTSRSICLITEVDRNDYRDIDLVTVLLDQNPRHFLVLFKQ